MRFLSDRHGSDVVVDLITTEDIRAFRAQLPDNSTLAPWTSTLRALTRALFELELCPRDLWEVASERFEQRASTPQVGFAPSIFTEVLAAAMRDVEGIVERIRAGESLLRSFREDATALSDRDREIGAMLDETAITGEAPRGGFTEEGEMWWSAVPRMIFLTRADVAPLMVLLAARTGRNSETLKELSATHRIRDGQMIETQTIKRRRGYESETVAWEIGGPTRRLKTAGGMYLLLHDLCRRSREFAGSDALLCIWSRTGGGQHQYPWAKTLTTARFPDLNGWAQSHALVEHDEPLRLTFGRIKTTVERERAQKNDYDLDRAAVTNSPSVLYRSYVSPDPTARRALQSIANAALLELDERLTVAKSSEKQNPISARRPITDEPDAISTAFMQCRDVLGNPEQRGIECTATFLDCFACPCAVVSDRNIPTILRLSEELADRFDRSPFDVWVERYGQAWLAIHNDILPSRTPEELANFAAEMPEFTALALLDEPEMF